MIELLVLGVVGLAGYGMVRHYARKDGPGRHGSDGGSGDIAFDASDDGGSDDGDSAGDGGGGDSGGGGDGGGD